MDENSPNSKSIREEVNALFGLRWDTLVEWIVISWLSIWFWVAVYDDFEVRWAYGPLSGIERFATAIDVNLPGWFENIYVWILSPENQWFAKVLIFISVVACVAAVRSHRLSGLRTVALVAAAVACEMFGGLMPVLWILLFSAVPAGLGCMISFSYRFRDPDNLDSNVFYYWEHILVSFGTKVVALFFAPVFAPILLAMQLVVSFRTDIPSDPVEELNREASFVLSGSSSDPSTWLESVATKSEEVSLQLVGTQSVTAKRIAYRYLYDLKELKNLERQRRRLQQRRGIEG